MPRCDPWEWNVTPCDCALKDCQLDITEVATAAMNAVVEAQSAGGIEALAAKRAIEGIGAAMLAGYEACRALAAHCKGLPFTPRPPVPGRLKEAAGFTSRVGGLSSAASGGTAMFMNAKAVEAAAVAAIDAAAAEAAGALAQAGTIRAASAAATAVAGRWALRIGALGVGFAIGAAILTFIAADPPDPNFEEPAEPDPPVPPQLPQAPEEEPELTDAFNAVLANQAVGLGYGRAMVTSLNRASGAVLAQRPDAVEMQLEAARSFAGDWAGALAEDAGLRAAVVALAGGSEVATTGMTIAEAAALREAVDVDGWPQRITDLMDQYGTDGDEREEMLGLMSLGINDLVGLCRPPVAIIGSASLADAEARTAWQLQKFSIAQPQ